MIIALEKKQNSIVEYVLYMWKVEDIIRSLEFNISLIEDKIIQAFDVDEATKQEAVEWYENIIQEMRQKGLMQVGHIDEVNATINELLQVHQSLLNTYQDEEYKKLFDEARPLILELANKTDKSNDNLILIALNGLYGYYILKLSKEEVSEDTTNALKTISKMLAHLARQYNALRDGKLELPKEKKN